MQLAARPCHWVCKSGAETVDKQTGEVLVLPQAQRLSFSVLTHTICQDTKVPLRLWFKIGYLMLTAKKGMSSLQVRRSVFGEDPVQTGGHAGLSAIAGALR